MKIIPDIIIQQVKAELQELDKENILVDGKTMKPSNCYYFGSNPTNLLFNTNCPEELKTKIGLILSKYSA